MALWGLSGCVRRRLQRFCGRDVVAVAASEASSSAISARFSSSSASCGKASPRRALKPGSQPETSATVRRSSASSTSKRPSAEFEAGDKAERGHVLFVSDGVG